MLSEEQLEQIRQAFNKEMVWSLNEPDIRIYKPRVDAGIDMVKQILVSLGLKDTEANEHINEWIQFLTANQMYKGLFGYLWHKKRE